MTVATSTSVIRQWARTQGLTVGDRGRLSPQVLDAYATSHDQIEQSVAPVVTTATQVIRNAGLRIGVRPAPGVTGNKRTISARAAKSAAFR